MPKADPDVLPAARAALTAKQYEAWLNAVTGVTPFQLAVVLGLSKSSIVDRLDAARRRLTRVGVVEDETGYWRRVKGV